MRCAASTVALTSWAILPRCGYKSVPLNAPSTLVLEIIKSVQCQPSFGIILVGLNQHLDL